MTPLLLDGHGLRRCSQELLHRVGAVAVAGSGCVSAGGHWGEEAAAQKGDR